MGVTKEMRGDMIKRAIEVQRGQARRDILVRHPAHGETLVKAARDKLDAITEAARRWGAQWSKIAREAEFEETRSTREQGDKTGAEQKAKGSPGGAGLVFSQSEGLAPVAEGAERISQKL